MIYEMRLFYAIILFMRKKETYTNKNFKIMVFGMAAMIIIAAGSLLILSYVVKNLNRIEEDILVNYDAHYVYIVNSDEADFWDEVYESACEQAAEDHIYIEDLKKSMKVNYSNKDLFRVAINSSVDGIIFGGTPDEDMVELINRAVSEGIGVVLLQNDADSSIRQCFIGVNNYELGQAYASQIDEVIDNEKLGETIVRTLVNSDMSEGATNVFTLAIEDYFSEKYPDGEIPEVEIARIDSRDVFSAEEDIRSSMLDENLPDVMICLSSTFTKCAYQALVDLNRVADTQIVGYFADDTILDAVDRKLIYSTISVDTDQMGRFAVQALKEYTDIGYTNSYMSVSISKIGQNEARRIINERAKE